jgi:hypothetical protein
VTAVKAVGGTQYANVIAAWPLMTTAKLNEYRNAGIRVWLWPIPANEPGDAEETETLEKLWNLGKAYAWVANDIQEVQEYLASKEAVA